MGHWAHRQPRPATLPAILEDLPTDPSLALLYYACASDVNRPHVHRALKTDVSACLSPFGEALPWPSNWRVGGSAATASGRGASHPPRGSGRLETLLPGCYQLGEIRHHRA